MRGKETALDRRYDHLSLLSVGPGYAGHRVHRVFATEARIRPAFYQRVNFVPETCGRQNLEQML
jgi:hypothetical protein